jgi:hypothetical protein
LILVIQSVCCRVGNSTFSRLAAAYPRGTNEEMET